MELLSDHLFLSVLADVVEEESKTAFSQCSVCLESCVISAPSG